MHTPRLGGRAYFRGCSIVYEGGLVASLKNHQPNEASMSTSPRACIPCSRCPELTVAPVAWLSSVICSTRQGLVKICEQNLYNRLWLLLGNLRRLGISLLCSSASCAVHWLHLPRHHHHTIPPLCLLTCSSGRVHAFDIGAAASPQR